MPVTLVPPVPIDPVRVTETFVHLARQNTPPRSERAASLIGRDFLQRLGFTCRYDAAGEKVGGDIGNLLAFKKGTVACAPSVMFSAHFDTVEPTPGLEPIIEGDVIRSDGKTIVGADDKCGMAAILEAMRALVEQGIPHGDIHLILTICEEIGLVGAAAMDPSDVQGDMGFVLDSGPPVGSLIYSAPTQDIFDVRIHGKPSHAGAQPENGVSAILVAAQAISRMKLGRVDAETTANVGIIEGGTATNIIPAEVYLKCEARSRNPEKLHRQREHMFACLREEAESAGATVDIDTYTAYMGYDLAMDSDVIQTGTEAAERIGLEPILRVTGGGSDGNIFNTHGVPTTVLGCGMVNIHRHDEYCTISDMVKSAQLVVSIVQNARRAGKLMLTQAVGRVTRHVRDQMGAQTLHVHVPQDRERQALNYIGLTGEASVGDQVLLNTTATTLRLGTGGYDFVIANLERRAWWNETAPGHIIKGRYLPCQHAVLTLEEQEQYADVWSKSLDGFPVIVGQLHSQIAPAAAALHLRGKKTAYIMTDAAALPMPFSQLVQQLKEAGLIAATWTCGQAWGGDYETVTLHSALLAAKYIAGCDAAIVCQGPGNAGTGTRTGFSGIEQAQNMDIAAALGGSPIAVVRMSDTDERPRHQGISHHTRTTLEFVRSRVRVALPAAVDVPTDIAARHEVLFADRTQTALDLLAKEGIIMTSMGRSPAQDPVFFASAAAAGMLA